MQCVKFEERLQQLLDERVAVETDRGIVEHAQSCPMCQSTLRAQDRLFTGLRAMSIPPAPRDLGHRVLDQMYITRRATQRRRWIVISLATAASLIVALLSFMGPLSEMARQNKAENGGLALGVSGSFNSAQELANDRATEDLRLLLREWVSRISDQSIDSFDSVDRLAIGMRPLALTFNLALDTLRRTLPGYNPPQHGEPQARFRAAGPSIG